MNDPLFLFYEEPDLDRWVPGDRHLRRLIRRLVRGPARPGGVMRWYLNLRAGLDEIGAPYRVNDYRGLRRTPGAWAHVIGKSHVVEKIPSGHPIIYGPGINDHPTDNAFWHRADLRLIAIPCPWFKALYDRDLPVPLPTTVWPAGIDTALWAPAAEPPARDVVLVYDKIRWRRDEYEPSLLNPIREALARAGMAVRYLRYGYYAEEDYQALLPRVGAMVFLCEHETQGFAYLQALSSGVPIFAWDRGGDWQDPRLYPHTVRFSGVTSVPYFDARCGERFADLAEFTEKLPAFLDRVARGAYRPREYVTENLTLAGQARAYLALSAAAQAASAR